MASPTWTANKSAGLPDTFADSTSGDPAVVWLTAGDDVTCECK